MSYKMDSAEHSFFYEGVCNMNTTQNNDNKNDEMINFWYIPITLIFLFAISIFNLPYGFYTFLRIITFGLSLLFAFAYYCCKGRLSFISCAAIAIAILWNPIIPIYLDKETWVRLDIIGCVIELIMLICSYKICKEK